MKKILLLAVMAVVAITYVDGQDYDKENTETNISQKLSGSSTILKQETILMDDIATSGAIKDRLGVSIIILSSLGDESKISGVRLTTYYSSSNFNYSFYGYIDSDEITACIDNLKKINEVIINSKPENPTEYSFITRGKVRFECYFIPRTKKWHLSIQPNEYYNKSQETFDLVFLSQVIERFEMSLEIIKNNNIE